MAAPIDFYFDFSSPYGYFASERIDALAARHGRAVLWHPILLGAIFKVTGGAPLPSLPLKGDYAMKDIPRTARFMGIPLSMPGVFPINSISPVRGFYWLAQTDAGRARDFAQACYRAYFGEGVNISDMEKLVVVADSLGIDRDAFSAGLADAAVKDRTKAAVDAALARGVFGSPTMIVDGEMFWGCDRLDQLGRWLETGGF